jgi:hypothetical protein
MESVGAGSAEDATRTELKSSFGTTRARQRRTWERAFDAFHRKSYDEQLREYVSTHEALGESADFKTRNQLFAMYARERDLDAVGPRTKRAYLGAPKDVRAQMHNQSVDDVQRINKDLVACLVDARALLEHTMLVARSAFVAARNREFYAKAEHYDGPVEKFDFEEDKSLFPEEFEEEEEEEQQQPGATTESQEQQAAPATTAPAAVPDAAAAAAAAPAAPDAAAPAAAAAAPAAPAPTP